MTSHMQVERVYAARDGSHISPTVTAGSPADGGDLSVEFVTDFQEEGGTAYFDDVVPEKFFYTGIDEITDKLLDVGRPNAASHPAGTFIYAGNVPRTEFYADGFIDGSSQLTKGVYVPHDKIPFLKLGRRDSDSMDFVQL